MSPADAAAERRQHHRFPMIAVVRIYSGSAMWSTALIDVSLSGVLVQKPADWSGAEGSLFRLDMKIESGPIIAMSTRLVRNDETELAFAREKLDLDSFSSLKRLIELNLGNTEALYRELAMLGR